jgi:hypothetical protein
VASDRDRNGDLVIGRDADGAPFTDGKLSRRTAEWAAAHSWIGNGHFETAVWPESKDHGRDYANVPVWHFRIVRVGEVVPVVAGHLHLERDEDGVIRAVLFEKVPVSPFFFT